MTQFCIFYHDGQEVRPGDRVLYARSPGRIAFIVRPDRVEAAGEADAEAHGIEEGPGDDSDWIEEGPGVMIECESMGRVFLSTTEDEEDLILVGRG